MPEGDTVFALARRLRPALVGHRLEHAELRVPAHATAELAGSVIAEIDTYGKHMLTRFSTGLTLRTHLRMTGSWTVVRSGKRLPGRVMPEVRVLLGCHDGPTAYGLSIPVVDLMPTADEAAAIGHLGPDPLRRDWDPSEAVTRLSRDPCRALGAALLDQTLIAGLGNLWMNELCFLRGHSPWTPAGSVDLGALVTLAATALTHSATVPGAMQVTTGNVRRGQQHWVAGRAGKPCLRCHTTVSVVPEHASGEIGRRTWWCPSCQPGPSPGGQLARRR